MEKDEGVDVGSGAAVQSFMIVKTAIVFGGV
jgi:hypothetical protein